MSLYMSLLLFLFGGVLHMININVFYIWTVRYGSRLASMVVLEEEDDDHTRDFLLKYEICPNNTVECDGIRDCHLGSDETDCGKYSTVGACTLRVLWLMEEQQRRCTKRNNTFLLLLFIGLLFCCCRCNSTIFVFVPSFPVRFGDSSALQVRTAHDGRFLPVCYQGWNQSYADQTCAQLGFRR